MIVDCDEIDNLDDWLKDMLHHSYLKFTFEHSFTHINFLDVTVSLTAQNKISTTIVSKPMPRHQY